MNTSYTYSIKACNYSKSSDTITTMVKVDIVYKSVSAKDLVGKFSTYQDTYVKVTGLRIVSSYFSGSDLLVLARNGKSYLYIRFENYKNWDFDDGMGFYGKTKITSFWVRGIVETSKKSLRPVINADYVYYYYN